MIRAELVTPAGDLLQSETYNKMFTMHGLVMVFFFLIPSIPGCAWQFPIATHDWRARSGFSAAELAELVRLHRRRAFHALCCRARRRRHRLDVLYALQQYVFKQRRRGNCRRCLYHGFFIRPYGLKFHRHHSQDACAGPNVVPHAVVRLGSLCDVSDHGSRDARLDVCGGACRLSSICSV